MSNSDVPNTPLENLLSAVTDALLTEDSNLEAIIKRYNVPRGEVSSLLWVIRRLHVTLVGVQPSQNFVKRLRADLAGNSRRRILHQVRHLPPRVQVAAGLTLIIGLMFVQRRRMVDDAAQESQEIPTLQTHTQ